MTIQYKENYISPELFRIFPTNLVSISNKKGPFTQQVKNGTDLLKSDTVPIVFLKKYQCCFWSTDAYGAKTARV